MKRTCIETVRAARLKSVPILAVGTADQQAFSRALASLNGPSVKLTWDCARGIAPLCRNAAAAAWLADHPVDESSMLLWGALAWCESSLPTDGMLVAFNAHLFLNEPMNVQAVSNVRDAFKADGRTLIMLGPGFRIGPELQHDVVLIDEELPGDDSLGEVLDRLFSESSAGGVEMPAPSEDERRRALDAARGLSLFEAEQVYALSLHHRNGLDVEAAWDRKRTFIKQTQGLMVARGGLTLDELAGWGALKELGRDLRAGAKPPRVIVFWDEIEKAMAGSAGGDLSGVAQDAKGQILTTMEELEWNGVLLLGPAGVGKSAYARGLGADIGCETVMLDVNGTKGSLMGQSEQAIRNCLKTIEAIGGGSVFVVATCNDLALIDAPLRRRFKAGIYFCDLPSATEREDAWRVHSQRFGLDPAKAGPRPKDEGWTGAEIRNACELAWQLGCTLEKAATRIVPVVKSDAKGLAALREQAHMRFLDASRGGIYRKPDERPAEGVRAMGGR